LPCTETARGIGYVKDVRVTSSSRASAGRVRCGGLLGSAASAASAGLALAMLLGACTGTEQAVFAVVVDPAKPPVLGPDPAGAGEPTPGLDAEAGPNAGSPAPPDPLDAGVDASGPDPGLDPTVTFAWTETLPGAGTCRGGRYAGSFTCSADELLVPITGEVTVLLSVDPEEQTLAIEEGSVKGAFFLAPTIQGGIDCTSRAFEGVTIDGMDLFTQESFEASMSGTLDVDTLVIDGEFVLTNSAGQECRGTFRLGAAP